VRRDVGSSTAEGVAIARALEQVRPERERLLEDPYSAAFAGQSRRGRFLTGNPLIARAFATVLRFAMPGTVEFIAVRGRYSDELVRREANAGAKQFVIFGAGFDTAALRLGGELRDLAIFEVDHPATQAVKREIVSRIDSGLETRVRYVAVDFERDDVSDRLLKGGFDPNRRSVVTWMGVTYYLTAAAIDSTLDHLARLLAPGSALAFDYVLPSVVDGTTTNRTARLGTRRAARAGEPFLFGLPPSEAAPLLARHGFALEEQARPDELVARYTRVVRSAIDFAFLVTARRAG
jgi:methyltransferase (TIGR00027 family)